MTSPHPRAIVIMLIFGLQPMGFGAWLALIPEIKESLGLSKAQLSLCLLGMPLALVPMLHVASGVVSRTGPRRTLMASFPVLTIIPILPAIAPNGWMLFFALGVMGAAVAFPEAGMNVYAGRLEKVTGRTVMNRCHGFWALGLMAGSGLATLLSGLSPLTIMALVAIPSAALATYVSFILVRLRGDESTGVAPPRRTLRATPIALILISLFVFAVTLTEGAMADWAAIYLAERLPEGAGYEGIAVTIFAGFMAAGRFIGDAAKLAVGPVPLARLTVCLALLGVALLVIPLPLWLSYPGFALLGVGVSVAYPLGVSASAALDDTYEAPNIAIMSMIAVSGFVVGPPLIGFLSEAFSLRVGFAALIPLLIGALMVSAALDSRRDSESGQTGESV